MAQKILVVDDDTYLRDLYEEVLKDEGFEVDIATDGQEGLAKMTEGGYDLILLDVVMPKMDGLSVLNALSQNSPQSKNGPIILLTNLAHDPIIKEALSKGAHSYLIKTDSTPDKIIENVKKILSDSPISTN